MAEVRRLKSQLPLCCGALQVVMAFRCTEYSGLQSENGRWTTRGARCGNGSRVHTRATMRARLENPQTQKPTWLFTSHIKNRENDEQQNR